MQMSVYFSTPWFLSTFTPLERKRRYGDGRKGEGTWLVPLSSLLLLYLLCLGAAHSPCNTSWPTSHAAYGNVKAHVSPFVSLMSMLPSVLSLTARRGEQGRLVGRWHVAAG